MYMMNLADFITDSNICSRLLSGELSEDSEEVRQAITQAGVYEAYIAERDRKRAEQKKLETEKKHKKTSEPLIINEIDEGISVWS